MKFKLNFVHGIALAAAIFVPSLALAAWEADPGHTHVTFEVAHMGTSVLPGFFRKVATQLNYDDNNIEASSVTITIDSTSIDTVNSLRDNILRSPDWLDAEKNPSITFVSTSVRRVDDTNFVIAGNLTIRGKTLPVEFATTLTNRVTHPLLKVPAIGFTGTTRIKRSEFGLVKFIPMVADELELRIRIELDQKP